jgi:hypothetical protein
MDPIDNPESEKSHRTFDEMTWPCPGDRLNRLQWVLRYGTPTKEDLLLAASVLSAYHQMVWDPLAKRQKVIAELRKGPN